MQGKKLRFLAADNGSPTKGPGVWGEGNRGRLDRNTAGSDA